MAEVKLSVSKCLFDIYGSSLGCLYYVTVSFPTCQAVQDKGLYASQFVDNMSIWVMFVFSLIILRKRLVRQKQFVAAITQVITHSKVLNITINMMHHPFKLEIANHWGISSTCFPEK